jgi:hypothetical protein
MPAPRSGAIEVAREAVHGSRGVPSFGLRRCDSTSSLVQEYSDKNVCFRGILGRHGNCELPQENMTCRRTPPDKVRRFLVRRVNPATQNRKSIPVTNQMRSSWRM